MLSFIRPSSSEKGRRSLILKKMEEVNLALIDLSETCKMYGDLDLRYEQSLKYKEYITLNREYAELERQLYGIPQPKEIDIPVSNPIH